MPSTSFRLVIVCPITWSRSARVEVSEAVWASSWSMLPPSPCSTWMISPDSSLTSFGDNAANSGLNPLKRTSRSSAGWVRLTGIVPPARSGAAEPVPSVSATNRWPIRLR